jgi:DNA-binding winged helix-turn-helix (wHTH) protein
MEGASLLVQRKMAPKVYDFGNWKFDSKHGDLIAKGGRRENLAPKDAPTLEFLIERRTQIVSRREILDAGWGKDFAVEENNADQSVGRIREKLDRLGMNGKAIIETVPKRGYRFALEPLETPESILGAGQSSKPFIRSRVFIISLFMALIVLVLGGYRTYRAWNRSLQQQKLMSRNLPATVFIAQNSIQALNFAVHTVNDFAWLQNNSVQEITIGFDGSSLRHLSNAKALTALSLDLRNSQVKDLAELGELSNLKSLTLVLSDSPVTSLTGLEDIKGLTSLTLYLGSSKIQSLAGLEKLDGLTSLVLDFGDSWKAPKVTSLKELTALKRLTSLTLNLSGLKVEHLGELAELPALTSLYLDVRHGGPSNLLEVGKIKGLQSLTLLINFNIKSLAGLEELKNLSSLSLTPDFYDFDLSELSRVEGITSLSLDLRESSIKSFTAIERLKKLNTLQLAVGGVGVRSYEGLAKLSQLTSLTLNLNESAAERGLEDLSFLKQLDHLTSLTLALESSRVNTLMQIPELPGLTSLWIDLDPRSISDGWTSPHGIRNLAGIERFTGLTALKLNLQHSNVKSLAGIEQLEKLTTLILDARNSQIKSLAGLENLKELRRLDLSINQPQINDLGVLEHFRHLESQQLIIPAPLFDSLNRLKIRSDITEAWIIIGSDYVPDIPPHYKFIVLTD